MKILESLQMHIIRFVGVLVRLKYGQYPVVQIVRSCMGKTAQEILLQILTLLPCYVSSGVAKGEQEGAVLLPNRLYGHPRENVKCAERFMGEGVSALIAWSAELTCSNCYLIG